MASDLEAAGEGGRMIVEERSPSRAAVTAEVATAGRWTPLAAVLALLPITAMAELLLVRGFYRVGIFIPKDGLFGGVHAALTQAGSMAFNLSSVLAILALSMLAAAAFRRGLLGSALSLGAFVSAILLAAVSGAPEVAPVVRAIFLLAAFSAARPALRTGGVAYRAAVGGVTITLVLASLAGFAQDAGRLAPGSGTSAGIVPLQLAGEAAVVLSGLLLFAAWAARDRLRVWPVAAGLGAALGLLALWSANGAVTGIVVMWTAGLRLYLPVIAYAAALWAYSSAAAGWFQTLPWRGAGMALLLAAGFLMESTYLLSLALLGLVLLTDGLAVGGLPALPRRLHRGLAAPK